MNDLCLTASRRLAALGLTPDLVPIYFGIREKDALDGSTADQWPKSALKQLKRRRLIRLSKKNNRVSCIDPFDVLPRPLGKRYKTIFDVESPYQDIELYRIGKDHALFLNDEIQFYTSDDEGSHELMIGVPLCLAKRAKRVLILGGGDGLAVQEALRFDSVERVRLVELCPGIVELAGSDPTMRKINGDSLNDPRTDVIVGDALDYVLACKEKYDVVIDDCDYSVTQQPETANHRKYLRYLRALPGLLTEGGVGSIMFATSREETDELELLAGLIEETGETPVWFASEQTFRGKLRAVMNALFPHTLDCEYRSFFLDAEVYTFFAGQAPHAIYRRPAVKSPVLDAALDHFGAFLKDRSG